MRRLPFLLCALTLLAAPASVPAAGPGTGGATAPSFSGGVTYGQPLREVRRARRVPPPRGERVHASRPGRSRPAARDVRVPRRRRDAHGARADRAHARGRAARRRSGCGWATGARGRGTSTSGRRRRASCPRASTRSRCRRSTTPATGCAAPRSASGRDRLTRPASRRPRRSPTAGVFPVQGAYDFGGEDARFGAGRDGHVHQGQDITAAEGTPLVAPVAATVTWVAFQAEGAGHYVVLRGADGRDYVFMHLKTGSVTVAEGAVLAAGAAVRAGRQHGRLVGPAPALRDLAGRLVFLATNRSRSTRSRSSRRGRGRASLFALGEIAQLVEHTTENRGVPGSSPGLAIRQTRMASGFSCFSERLSDRGDRVPDWVLGPRVIRVRDRSPAPWAFGAC